MKPQGFIPFFRGRGGLHAILRALDIGAGDEVITQAFTCVAVPEAILAAGATPVYADLSAGSPNMDPADAVSKITPRTRAIVVQHTFGIAGPIAEVVAAAASREIAVIEDCCHSFSTRVDGIGIGSLGDAAFYSLEWGKPLPCGVGGLAFAQDEEIRARIAELALALRRPGLWRQFRLECQYAGFSLLYRPATYWFVKAVFNRLSALGAAESNFNETHERSSEDFELSMAPLVERRFSRKLSRLDQVSAHSRRVCSVYNEMPLSAELSRVSGCESGGAVLVRYPLWAANKAALVESAQRQRIELAGWYATPIHPLGPAQLAAVGYQSGQCPIAERACDEIVSLPTNAWVDDGYLEKVQGLLA